MRRGCPVNPSHFPIPRLAPPKKDDHRTQELDVVRLRVYATDLLECLAAALAGNGSWFFAIALSMCRATPVLERVWSGRVRAASG